MGKIAFVFPGQGAQAVGMGQDAYRENEASKQIFERADAVLGFKLSELIFQGPEQQLKQTIHTQPALLTASIALFEAFRDAGVRPDYLAGHSLGEYSALVVAGALSFEDAVKTVRQRGEFMEQAVPSGIGGMAAVLGADRDRLRQLCLTLSADFGPVEPANLNCPGQIVVSGTREGVQALAERGREAGAKRVIPLEVSGPFHSSLMKPAAEKLSAVLAGLPMRDASVPVIANVTSRPAERADDIRRLLTEQVCSPVLWEDSIVWMIEQGVDTFYEIGSGSVLTGLIKKIDRGVSVFSLNSLAAIDAVRTGG